MNDILPFLPDSLMLPRPLVIAGPCSAESEQQVLNTASALSQIGVKVFRAGVWKPRTMPGGFEGVGAIALPWLVKVKQLTGMLVATEVANKAHVDLALEAGIDILWIGARTSANPFAVQEIADAIQYHDIDIPVLVKNPVSPDLDLWIGSIRRLYNAGLRHIGAVHRGFSAFGSHLYRNIPEWQIPIEFHRRFPHISLICDPSHIGGNADLIEPLAQQALDMGFNGLIIESHCNPPSALSDSRQQITPEQLHRILSNLILRDSSVTTETLESLRAEIDKIDNDIIQLIARRMDVAKDIAVFKKEHDMSVVQINRHDEIMKDRIHSAQSLGLSPEFMKRVLSALHCESVRQQLSVINNS
ncbi:MAG: bifunctional 3-deoxy-7-phosphoheptulonate synthase/chorismate mutase type II [Muribaculum sp.]|nr:bifunctional 3-deoxy-7-phosphoheptulonate synthase/chorismate mutase type II [Muribaculum sp.]